MSFCVVRCEKLKTMAHLGKAYAHNSRSASVPNADQNLRQKNEILVDMGNITDAWKSKVGAQKFRSDAVLGIQVTLIRSPDWVGDEKAWTRRSQEWLETQFGKENVLSSVVHRDEKTPHLQALVVPLVDGKLNAKAHLGGAAKLAKMQTSYAAAMSGLGLVRGSEWSQAKHGDIHEHYAHIETARKTAPEPPKSLLRMVSASEAERVHKEALAAHTLASELKLKELAAVLRARAAESELAKSRVKTDQLRSLSLAIVAELLGGEQDKSDRQKWRLPSGDLVALEKEGSRFHLVNSGGGGRGAVDLTMKALGVGFYPAVGWLESQFGPALTSGELRVNTVERMVTSAKKNHPTAGIPAPVPENWERVRKYLVEVRKLAVEIVDKLAKEGRIYADAFCNAVFAHRGPSGSLGGVELRGTGKERFAGARGAKAGFYVEGSKPGVMICESAIDALSVMQLTGISAVGVGGSNLAVAKEWAEWAKVEKGTVYVGFDNDAAGAKQAAALREVCAWVPVRKPPGGKDWNEALQNAEPAENLQEISFEQMANSFGGNRPRSKAPEQDRGHSRGGGMER